MEPHETHGNTPSGNANAVWFDDWSTGGSFDSTNEHTTSVWKPTHLLGLTQAARNRAKTSAFEQQMTWEDESTTRMWNAQFVAQSFFASARGDTGPQQARSHAAPAATLADTFKDVAAPRSQPPPPPRNTRQTGAHQAPPVYASAPAPIHATASVRQTGQHNTARHTPPPPPAARQTGGYQVPARQTGGYQAPTRQTGGYQAPARTTGARPAVRSTQPNRPIVTAGELGLATHVTDELFARVHSQQISWIWTLGFAAALFAAVLFGMVLLPIGTPNISGISPPPTPVLRHVDSFPTSDTTGSTEAPSAQPGTEQPATIAAEPAVEQPQPSAEPALVQPEPSVQPAASKPVEAAADKPAEPTPRHAGKAPSNVEPRAAKPHAPAQPKPVAAAPAPPKAKPEKAEIAKAKSDATAAEKPNAVAPREAVRTPVTEKHDDAAAARAAVRNQEPGLLRINSRPWAQIFIDGQPRGATPQMGLPLKPGHHTVQLVNTPLRMSKTFPLDVQPGAIVTKVVNLIE